MKVELCHVKSEFLELVVEIWSAARLAGRTLQTRTMHERSEALVVQAASLQLSSAGKLSALRIGFMHNPG